MSDADLLRRAARHARITARLAATARPTPWTIATEDRGTGIKTTVRCADGRHVSGFLAVPVAIHIHLWHPGVARAVAEWLESEADVMEIEELSHAPHDAVTIARALLREDAAHDPGADQED